MLEEMPAFPERESSILALLKRKKPGRVPDSVEGKEEKMNSVSPVNANQVRSLSIDTYYKKTTSSQITLVCVAHE